MTKLADMRMKITVVDDRTSEEYEYAMNPMLEALFLLEAMSKGGASEVTIHFPKGVPADLQERIEKWRVSK